MDRQHYLDLLFENESLTDNLDDADARLLLQWGADHLDSLPAADLEARFTALVQFLRGVNRLAGALPDVSAGQLSGLLALYRAALGDSREPDSAELERAAQSLSYMTAAQAVPYLLGWALPAPPPAIKPIGDVDV